jgi:hypothetical protein
MNVARPPHLEHRNRFAQLITVVVAPYRSTSPALSGSKLCRHCSHQVIIRTPALSACPKVSGECVSSRCDRRILTSNEKKLSARPSFRVVISYGIGATIRASEMHPLLIAIGTTTAM